MPLKDLEEFQAERTANVNILRQKHARHVRGRKRRPACLKHREWSEIKEESRAGKALKSML